MATGNADSGRGEHLPPFALFALLWAITTLVHQLSFPFWMEKWQGWLVTYATFLVLLEPRCLIRFTCLILTSLLNLGHKLPFVPNHILFEGMINLTILIGIAWTLWQHRAELPGRAVLWREFRQRSWPFFIGVLVKFVHLKVSEPPRNHVIGGATTMMMLAGLGNALNRAPLTHRSQQSMFHAIAPVIRLEIVIMYFWAAIQKMNWDYLNPEVSCAATLHTEIAEFLPVLPTGTTAQYIAIHGSLLFELGIPIFLLFKRTRFLGFLAAIWFHLWLSLHPAPGIYSFSSLIFGSLVFFLPGSVLEDLQSVWDLQKERLTRCCRKLDFGRWLRWGLIVVFLGCAISQASLYINLGRTRETFDLANRIGFWFWLLWGLWLGGCYLTALWRNRQRDLTWPNRLEWSPLWIGVALTALNGLNPWIGLKTQTSFSMYSNLRSEMESNHLFLRRIDLFPLQSDLVELIHSEPDLLAPPERPKKIQQFANKGNIFPYFELRRLMSEYEGDLKVTYRRDGQEYLAWRLFDNIAGDEKLFEPIPWILYKALWFRRHVSYEGPMHCTH